MKTIHTLLLMTGLAAASPLCAADATNAAPPLAAPPEAAAPATPTPTAVPEAAASTNAPVLLPNGEPGLRLNFRGASLEAVLDYLSEAAGYIIVLDTQVRGKVDMWSSTPVSKEEALNLLNTVLNKNGYAAVLNGRTLTVVNKDEVKTRGIPVKNGADPESIPVSDLTVTQIIPVRFVQVTQLLKDIQPLISSATTITANEDANTIVITDTQANIRRVAEIIKAIDLGAEGETLIRVFRLQYADPVEMAELLTSVFPDESKTSSGNSSPVRFGGLRSFFGGGDHGRGGGGGSSANNSRIKKQSRVTAVPDQRTASVIVSGPGDLMDQIEGMIQQLDANPAKRQQVFVYPLENADVSEVEQVLQDMFERNSTSNNRNRSGNNTSALGNRSTQDQNSGSTRSNGRSNNRSGIGGGN